MGGGLEEVCTKPTSGSHMGGENPSAEGWGREREDFGLAMRVPRALAA